MGNDLVQRELTFDGKAWRTTRFIAGTESLETQSDEFHIRMMDDAEFTVSDFVAAGQPVETKDGGTSVWTIRYQRPAGLKAGPSMPVAVTVRYSVAPGERWTRKAVALEFPDEATVDRLEVERFSAQGVATRGGRGEPVFLGDRWFFGLEYPAGHSRHTDGNTPEPDKHHYELVGNYSFVDLEGHDKDAHPRPGLIRLFHFPGYAVKDGGTWKVASKTAVAGGGASAPVTGQFQGYLKTIQKADRSFTHYNNWFDPAGKSLKVDSFTAIYRDFAKAVKPYGVKIDAMVPDDGWQNRKSVWEPTPRDFPGGFPDLVALSEALRKEGTELGLWLALDGTNTDVKWGESQGYPRAKANKYFSRYFAHYSLSHPAYQELLRKQLVRLAGEGKVGYFKHDFNHLSDVGEGNGHPPTDRHGHEANVDAMISLLKSTREANPRVYQNLTNWMWFSPWWLMHGDALWMLAGDDGANGNWPELSVRNMATTDRDTFLWRMWGDPKDRPLVPVSRLMTHGIILNERHQLEGPGDGVREWADHVMMYYGRGIQMKEWYITPKTSTPEHWKALGTIHRWAEKNFKALAKTDYVGGRPDEGHVYGYIGWDGGHGVLVTRNPSAETQVLEIPSAPLPGGGSSRVVFPYHGAAPVSWSGGTIRVEVPGYQTLALEVDAGPAKRDAALSAVPVKVSGKESAAMLPSDTKGRAEVLVIGYPDLPEVKINGQVATPLRTSKAKLNPFPGYARAGMPSDKARAWTMASFDVKALVGKELKVSLGGTEGSEATAEAWLLVERAGKDASFPEDTVPWAIDAGLRRQTVRLIAEAPVAATALETRALTPAEFAGVKAAKLTIGLFGVNDRKSGEKTLWLNGRKLAELPAGGDQWQTKSLDLDAEAVKGLKASNAIEVRRSTAEDKFKFRAARLRVQLADGIWVQSSAQPAAQTTDKDWAFFEGSAFTTQEASAPVTLEFK
ncbi:hypothetical protein llg_21110 [Luteolibacter sp. LG18]|nr:hypothetical protein llg_21110 [Luteolibacter sp. LG18]